MLTESEISEMTGVEKSRSDLQLLNELECGNGKKTILYVTLLINRFSVPGPQLLSSTQFGFIRLPGQQFYLSLPPTLWAGHNAVLDPVLSLNFRRMPRYPLVRVVISGIFMVFDRFEM